MQYPTFQKKSPLTAADLNSLVDVLKRARVLPGVGIKLTETLNGTVVSLKPTRSGGGAFVSESFPFQIESYTKTDSFGNITGYKATIRPGTLNNLLPTNLFENNTLRFFSYNENAIFYVILKGFSNGKEFTSCQLAVESAAPPAQPATLFSLPEEVQILIGVVYNSQIYQVVNSRIELVGKQLFIKDRDTPPEVGQLPYEAYFVWG